MNYLDDIAKNYSSLKGMDKYTNIYQYKTIQKYFIGYKVLELGSADGKTTNLLINDFNKVTAVDGSQIAINRLKEQINSNKLETIIGFFEEIVLSECYDTIVMGHILEHVEDPVFILNKFKEYLNNLGRIIVTVPNAKSIHRIAGVNLGLLKSIYDLNETDLRIGHKRIYDYERLKKDIEQAKLNIVARDAYWLKFLSNKQIEEQWDEKLIETYMEMGNELIEYAAEIVVVCEK